MKDIKRLDLNTPDGAQLNMDELYKIAPSVFTESRDEKTGELKRVVNFDALRQLLGDNAVDESRETYEFRWVGKDAAKSEAARAIDKTLRPVVEDSVDWDTTKNLYIEGDNLEVLKLLQRSYMGKVKMIYIDPPYNTGNDFVYHDDFAMSSDEYDEAIGATDELGNKYIKNTETSGRFHSDWCNMIYPRLMVARSLLAEDGVIFINIDKNEISNLQKICSEIFGEKNDLGTIIWDKRNPKGDSRGISYQHEYVVAYSKDFFTFIQSCKLIRPKKNAKMILDKAAKLFSKVSSNYTLKMCNSDFSEWIKSKKTELSGGESAYNRIDGNGDVYQSVSMGWPNKKKAPDEYFIPLVHPITKKACPVPERGWRNPPATMKELENKGLIIYGIDETTQPRRKYLLKDNMFENIPSLIYYGGSDTDILTEMKIPFDTPKVVDIVKEHIQSLTKTNSIILDFFSGSATTAHAVMQLNAEDGGNRKFIMVQLQEETPEDSEAYKAGYKNICEIGKERIRRAGKKIKEEHPLTTQDLDTGFRVLRLDDSNFNSGVKASPSEYNQQQLDLFANNIKSDRTDLDLLFGSILAWGLQLDLPMETEEVDGCKIYTVNDGDLVACFAEKVNDKVIEAMAEKEPLRVLFRDSCFDSDDKKINIFETFKQKLDWTDDEAFNNIRVI
ncbi:MAG: site-specific DNA-methyltransferase [Bacteroidales bacterium]|nr:site-specific DNA-methyltransferase [Bacteroidales bacterium]